MYLIQITYGSMGWADPKKWREMAKEAYATMGRFWFEHFRAKHFTKEGAAEYGYLPRKGEESGGGGKFWQSYTGRKQKEMGHTLPLVWSGESRDRSRMARITASANGVRISMNIPAFNWQNPNSKIHMRKEMETVSTAEARTLREVGQKVMDAQIRRFMGFRETKTIKS